MSVYGAGPERLILESLNSQVKHHLILLVIFSL